jgi:hypothetical protein
MLATLAGGIVMTLLAMTADATRQDLDAQWKSYAQHQIALDPAYTFPHATCFKAAALQYDLPETLLLAVHVPMRMESCKYSGLIQRVTSGYTV